MPSRLLLGARVRRMACLLVALMFVPGLARGAAAQDVVFHGSISSNEDNPAKDANGALNGTVVWAPGKVHVLLSYITIAVVHPIVIQSGAIIRFGSNLDVTGGSGVYRVPMPSRPGLL